MLPGWWMSRLPDQWDHSGCRGMCANCSLHATLSGALSETATTVLLSTVPRLSRLTCHLWVGKRTCGGGQHSHFSCVLWLQITGNSRPNGLSTACLVSIFTILTYSNCIWHHIGDDPTGIAVPRLSRHQKTRVPKLSYNVVLVTLH